jgi:hypothetical protein
VIFHQWSTNVILILWTFYSVFSIPCSTTPTNPSLGADKSLRGHFRPNVDRRSAADDGRRYMQEITAPIGPMGCFRFGLPAGLRVGPAMAAPCGREARASNIQLLLSSISAARRIATGMDALGNFTSVVRDSTAWLNRDYKDALQVKGTARGGGIHMVLTSIPSGITSGSFHRTHQRGSHRGIESADGMGSLCYSSGRNSPGRGMLLTGGLARYDVLQQQGHTRASVAAM